MYKKTAKRDKKGKVIQQVFHFIAANLPLMLAKSQVSKDRSPALVLSSTKSAVPTMS